MVFIAIFAVLIAFGILKMVSEYNYQKLEAAVLNELRFYDWNVVPYYDAEVVVKSRQTLEKYDDIRFFKENRVELSRAERTLARKREVTKIVSDFLRSNSYKNNSQYGRLEEEIYAVLENAKEYRIRVLYVSSAGNQLGERQICVRQHRIDSFRQNPVLLMDKAEGNNYLKEQKKIASEKKQHEYYERVNAVIDFANSSRDSFILKGSAEQVDKLIAQLFDRTVNAIKKVKTVESEEWRIIGDFITQIEMEVKKVEERNQRILAYYSSPAFRQVKETCDALMSSQREFNEYINEKVESISRLFGTRTVRNETVTEDEYSYVRPYKKTITPFSAEVSATVFASAENSPMEYLVKYFYPNKEQYPEQIQKLRLLLEELETLRDAKTIIDNYKMEYRRYLGGVPSFVMEDDEAGFYSRLGFANIDESVLTVEYKFVYTSGGGMAQRFFTIPMTEETIIELVRLLESKLSSNAFVKEQRAMMTVRLRNYIKQRDNFTCRICGNSTYVEQNLLLEIDHIVPVSKGGCTVEDNLQTLCWKCNRAKSNKIIA